MGDEPCCVPGEQRWTVLWPKSWTRVDDAPSLAPELAGWEDLPDREQRNGIRTAAPILLAPDGTIDHDLDRYVRRSGFLGYAPGTQKKYLIALCRILDLTWDDGRDWRETTADDILNLHSFRTEHWRPAPATGDGAPQPSSQPVLPQTWNSSDQAGLVAFFDWAHRQNLLANGHPVERRALRARQDDGSRGAPVTRGKPIGAEPVKWFTTAAFRRFLNIGFRGYGADELRNPAYAGRTGPRDVALAGFGWESGLRIEELTGLLLPEMPDVLEDRLYYRGRVTGKGRKTRDYWVGHGALQRTLDYVDTDRAEAVDRAKRARRYDKVAGLLLVGELADGKAMVAESRDPDRPAGRWLDLAREPAEVKRRLFKPGDDGFPEPMQLWLTEGGMPASDAAFQAQFREASRRCERALPGQGLRMTPHMLRHSFALHMLLALWHALRLRTERAGGSADEVTKLYGDHWTLVQQMLGHANQDVTRKTYLAPLQGLQIDDLLNDQDPLEVGAADSLVPRIARRSRLVLSLPGERAAAGDTFPEDAPETEPAGR